MAQPTFYVVAGPNGSGKTTFVLNDPTLKCIPFINTDIEAENLSPGSPAKAALAAGADGIMAEVHPDPQTALSDAAQQLDIPQFQQLWEGILQSGLFAK